MTPLRASSFRPICASFVLLAIFCTKVSLGEPLCLKVFGALANVPDMTSELPLNWVTQLSRAGYKLHGITPSNYVRFRHTDSSEVWIRPNGEVVRLAPKVTPSGGGKKYNPRVNSMGEILETHSTGEYVIPSFPR